MIRNMCSLQFTLWRSCRISEAVPALGVLFGPDHTLNHRVARALVAIGRVDAAGGRVLVQAMDSPHSTARIHAALGVINLYTR